MTDKVKKGVICTTVLVETSPQALPLGAACITSAINHFQYPKKDTGVQICAQLQTFSLEDPAIHAARSVDSKADLVARELIRSFQAQETHGIEPFALCLSVFVWNRFILEKAAQKVKEKFPSMHLIAGGPEVTANPASFTDFDYCTSGQGETAVPELLWHLASGTPPAEKIICAAAPDCATLPSPYLDGTLDPDQFGGVLWELARGCPFKCSYCYESKGEKTVRYLPMDRIEEEIDLFARKNVRQVFVLDPTYNAKKDRALQMLALIRRKLPDTYFYFEARAEFIDRELANAFSKVQCSLQFGLQSSDETVLKNVHRTFNRKQFVKNIGYLNQTGVVFGFDLIYGLPGDSYAGFKESIDFALSLYPNSLELFCLSVLPGTTLHDEAAGFNMVWEQQAPYHVIESPTFGTQDMAKAEELAKATTLFYTSGRAVPWFASVMHLLKMPSSQFLERFAVWLQKNGPIDDTLAFDRILELQVAFVKTLLTERNKAACIDLVTDIIRLNGALSAFTAEGTESTVSLHYHPDDLLSEYASDLVFFQKNAQKFTNRTKVFNNRGEADWKVLR
ncbi:MAG: radical SAM protein [Treponemataceae bacterium]|nr:radical SAM protein [Treponemataceae bacterium]